MCAVTALPGGGGEGGAVTGLYLGVSAVTALPGCVCNNCFTCECGQ